MIFLYSADKRLLGNKYSLVNLDVTVSLAHTQEEKKKEEEEENKVRT